MPTYEYRCNACAHEFEAEQRMSADPLKKCPECGKSKLERLISATAFHLKGGGWYKDLYSSNKDTAKGPAKSTSDQAEAKSEAKAEPKSESAGCGAAACGTGACAAAKTGGN
jgi:putative FmdB family regulatory protein